MNPTEPVASQSATPTAQTIGYRETLLNLLRVANQHKSNLFLTSLAGSAPIIIAIIYAGIASSNTRSGSPISTLSAIMLVLMVLSLVIAPFWIMLINRIAKIEQILWVKAYFDNNEKESQHSLRKAISLFWPSVRVSFGMLIHYYWAFWLAVVIFVAGLTYTVIHTYQTISPDTSPTGLILFVVISPLIILGVYFVVSQFVSLKARYVQIIFVTTYGQPNFSYSGIFTENKRLTKLDKAKGRSFAKLLALSMGTDATVLAASGAVTGAATGTTSAATGLLLRSSGAGSAAGSLVSMYGSEAASLTESLAQTIIFYTYYRSLLETI